MTEGQAVTVAAVAGEIVVALFIDSAGLAALIGVHDAATDADVAVRTGAATKQVTRVVTLAGLASMFGLNRRAESVRVTSGTEPSTE